MIFSLNFILVFFLFFSTPISVKPTFALVSEGSVTDFLLEDNILYAANDKGTVDIFDYSTKKLKSQISFPLITDFTGEMIPSKIYSVDKISGKDILLMTTQGVDGFRNVYVQKNGLLMKVVDDQRDHLMVHEARFLSENLILLGLLSNEIIYFDIQQNKVMLRKQISTASFSDFAINSSKTQFVWTDESGIIYLLNANSGEVLKKFENIHHDKIYCLSFHNNTIVSGGQDRKVAVIDKINGTNYTFSSNFMVYKTAISNSGTLAAYSANENSDIMVFNRITKETVALLSGTTAVLTKILFVTDNEVIASAEDNEILVWKF